MIRPSPLKPGYIANDFPGKRKILLSITQVLYLLYFTSFIFSLREISSISIGLLLLTGIIASRSNLLPVPYHNTRILLIIGCILFYLLQFVTLFYDDNSDHKWNNILMKSGLLLIPLAVCLTDYLDRSLKHKLIFYYCLILFTASVYCLFVAGRKYLQTGDSSVFYYHTLVSPLSQHAVFFSIYVFIALLFLLENISKENLNPGKIVQLLLVIFFSFFLFLLASKFVISVYLFYLLFFFILIIRQSKKKKFLLAGMLVVVISMGSSVLIIRNPVSNRFYEIINGDMNLIRQDRFEPADYFNGVQFRVLQWRFVTEILNEKQKWWTGVGVSNAQSALDQKYISENMYTGDPAKKNHGLLGYNTHNQFLESLLETGIPGLLIFIFICYTLIRIASKNKNRPYWFITMLLLSYSLIESVFETQYGISFFLFFPLFLGNIIAPGKK